MPPVNVERVSFDGDTLAREASRAVMGTYKDILAALVALRTAARVAQGELALRLGKVRPDGSGMQSTISDWETGRNVMGFDDLVAYAAGLGWTLRATLHENKGDSPEARFMRAVEGLTPGEVASLLEAMEAVIKAPPDARTFAFKILRSAGST